MKLSKLFLAIAVSAATIVITSCDRNEQALPTPSQKDTLNKVNEFVYNVVKDAYLWNDYIPGGIDHQNYSDPFNLFEDMYYPTLDHWSFLTDDYIGLLNSLQGTRKAAGFKFRIMEYSPLSNDLLLIVEYVHTDGEAYKAGLKRGDIIISVNDQQLTKENFNQLLNQESLKLGLGQINSGVVTDINKNITTNKIEQSFSPILHHSIIDINGTKVGYLVYDQFISEYEVELENAMASIAGAGATELVLDLRYNPGGYVKTCALLAGMIVPSVNLSDVFQIYQYNDFITKYYQDLNDGIDHFTEGFRTSSVNLDLSRVFVLTSDRSASASEAIINGLTPYMQVTTIGQKTAGKYTGARLFNDSESDMINNWGIYLITSRIANANGNTDYVDGFTPDYIMTDDYTTPLGDPTEPFLAKALSLISGQPVKSKEIEQEAYNTIGFSTESRIDRGISVIN